MFNEEGDWSDEEDAQKLSKSVFNKTQKINTSSDVKQSKIVGKKSLLRTLQALGSVPDWKGDDRQQGSDSEGEVASPTNKKKKKRRKKRKHTKTSDEHQENGDTSQHTEEKPAAKRGKKDEDDPGSPEVKTKPAEERKLKGKMKSAKPSNTKEPENSDRLSRKQWKNKMKNKRKCTNKYRSDNPQVDAIKPESVEIDRLKEEVGESYTNNNNNRQKSNPPAGTKKRKETKSNPQKRKMPDDATDAGCAPEIHSQTEEKQLMEEENKSIESHKLTPVETDHQHLSLKRPKPELSKDQTLKREKLRKMLQSKETEQKTNPEEEQKNEPVVPEVTDVKLDRSASLRSRMEQRLDAARFRYINEVLYSTTSGEATRMFKQDPEAFWIYHRGYTSQVQRWPSNPVDAIITYIQQRSSSLVVADFGCGDCKIARSVKNKVHSFDLAATCELVTVCDMANVPLDDDSVDIAVFCLSLMGTNLAEFLSEANRVLKKRGILKIAEVASRFDNVRGFMSALAKLGFKLLSKDTENTHFYSFDFEKTEDASENVKKVGLQLKPCLYKKR